MKGYTVRGCYPLPWQDIGSYKTAHAAICAMASRTEDYDNIVVHSPNGTLIAHYNAEGLK